VGQLLSGKAFMLRKLRFFISTGEVSGDLQGSLLIQALFAQAAQLGIELEILALGGDRMAAAGAKLLGNTRSFGAIGFFEALSFIKPLLALRKSVYKSLQDNPPDLVVLIDYPGFNIGLAQEIKRQFTCPIVYYIAPQEWAWAFSPRTTKKIVQRVDEILAIFPQEAEYYAKFGAKTTWVGHPFVDQVAQSPTRSQAREALNIVEGQTAIALLPASRPQEFRYIWPAIAAAAQQLQAQVPTAHFWIPVALEEYRPLFEAQIQSYQLRATLTQDSQLTLAAADLVIGKSGTANLEAALLNVPQVVVYRIHPVSAWLYRAILRFKVPFISPVNLIPMQSIVPELLQDAMSPETIVSHALELLHNGEIRGQMLDQYQMLQGRLGEPGVLSRAASALLSQVV
jgi:lipid-A-disaccharide synthase